MQIIDIPMALSLFPGLHATFYGAALLLHADHRDLNVPAGTAISTFTLWWICGVGFSSASAVFGVMIFGLFGPTVYLVGLGLMYVVIPRMATDPPGTGSQSGMSLTATLRTCGMITALSLVLALISGMIFGSPLS